VPAIRLLSILRSETVGTKDASKSKHHKQLALVSLVGTGLILIGSVLPILNEVFAPPQGYAVVNGVRIYSANVAANLLFAPAGDPLAFMKAALGGLIAASILFDVQVLIWNQERVTAVLTHPITQIIFGGVKGLSTAVQAVGVLGFIILSLVSGRLNISDLIAISPSEHVAEQFFHISLAPGFFILLVGFVIVLIIAVMNVGPLVATALLLIVVALFCTGHFDVVTNLFGLLDRINPLHYVGL
jgi:hypothetical protein